MKNIKKYSPPVPHLLQAQQALALLYAKVAGRPGTGSTQPPFALLGLYQLNTLQFYTIKVLYKMFPFPET